MGEVEVTENPEIKMVESMYAVLWSTGGGKRFIRMTDILTLEESLGLTEVADLGSPVRELGRFRD